VGRRGVLGSLSFVCWLPKLIGQRPILHRAYIIYVFVVTLIPNSFSMTSEGSGEQKCGGLMGEGGCLCNV
jgi:hypothetical protein